MADTRPRDEQIAKIRQLPEQVEAVVSGLTAEQLTARPLAGEWSVAQNVHHLADSHINSYTRMKLILDEEYPTLRPYDQDRWAAMPDAVSPDLSASLALLRGLHARWAALFAMLDESQWSRRGYHPENDADLSVEEILAYYAAHGEGHIDQIRRTLAAQG